MEGINNNFALTDEIEYFGIVVSIFLPKGVGLNLVKFIDPALYSGLDVS